MGETTHRARIALLGPANSIHFQRWANAMDDRGHPLLIISQHQAERTLLPEGAEVVWLNRTGLAGYFLNAGAVRHHLQKWQPDLLNVHYASGYGTTSALARFRPTLLSVWGSDVYEFPNQGRLKRLLIRWVLQKPTAIASTSRAMADQVRTLDPRRREISITPFGVDTTLFHPSQRSASEAGEVTIGIVKSLEPVYGIDVLLRAFAGLCADEELRNSQRRCVLVIVGGGQESGPLVELATQLGILDRTSFIGPVVHATVPMWLNRFDIYVAPSRSESFGVAVIEAGACGLPVVVSRVGGLPEVVVEGETGIIVPSEDVGALQAALKLLVLDSALRTRLGDEARAHVTREYEWHSCVDRMAAVYDKILGEY
jgi:L-malate glycosyltransferase